MISLIVGQAEAGNRLGDILDRVPGGGERFLGGRQVVSDVAEGLGFDVTFCCSLSRAGVG